MKSKLFIIVGCAVVVFLILLFGGNVIKEKLYMPINSTPEDTKVTAEITLEEAIMLKMACDDAPYEITKERLLNEEERILMELAQIEKQKSSNTIDEIKAALNASNIIQYYSLTGAFIYPENSDYKGELEACIVVVNCQDGTKKIDRVDWVSTHMISNQNETQWVQMETSSNIEVGGISARIAATGYFTASNSKSSTGKKIVGFENPTAGAKDHEVYSSTVYPVFIFYI